LKRKYEDFKRQMTSKEDGWKRKCDMLIEQNKIAQASNTADFEHYQTRIRTLEAEIIKNQVAPAADGPPPNIKQIADLKAVIEKRNAEIVFLKDTVRLECEERISLIAKLAVVTQNGSVPILEAPKIAKSVSCSLPAAPLTQDAEEASSKSSTSVTGRKTFEMMMHEAAIKKEKKLAKSSSRKKLYGI
jgi:Na+-translocating ferredoxin:NAD+ oxidoreductase RNF subunit RnfB